MTLPFKYQEVTKLTAFELAPSSFKFGVVSLESDKYLSAKENMPNGDSFLTIIELQNNMRYASLSQLFTKTH